MCGVLDDAVPDVSVESVESWGRGKSGQVKGDGEDQDDCEGIAIDGHGKDDRTERGRGSPTNRTPGKPMLKWWNSGSVGA